MTNVSAIGLLPEKYSDSSRYKAGKPCRHGHVHFNGQTVRHVANSTCVTCQSERISAYYRSAAGRATAKRSKLKHAAEIKARDAEYRKKNSRKIQEYNAEYRESNREWYLRYYRKYNKKRKILVSEATPAWADLDEIMAVYSEAEKLSDETGTRYEVDHIVPLNSPLVCGLHVRVNLRIITKSENSSKGNRWWPHE